MAEKYRREKNERKQVISFKMSEFAGSPPRRGRPPKYNSALPQLTNNTAVAIYATIIALMKHKIQTSPLDPVDDELWESSTSTTEKQMKPSTAISKTRKERFLRFLKKFMSRLPLTLVTLHTANLSRGM
jgi:hypothetical protein